MPLRGDIHEGPLNKNVSKSLIYQGIFPGTCVYQAVGGGGISGASPLLISRHPPFAVVIATEGPRRRVIPKQGRLDQLNVN